MSEIKIKTGFSQKKNEKEAVNEVFEQIKQEKMSLVIMFADGGYDQQKINQAWRERIPRETPFLGLSSLKITIPFFRIGENITSKGFKECLTAMSISSDKIKVAVKLMKNIKDNWEEETNRVLLEGEKEFNLDFKNIDPKKYFGIFLCDTTSAREDEILEKLYSITNLTFVGGGSIGAMSFKDWLIKGKAPSGYVHTKEGVFTNAAAIALVKCDFPFKIDLSTNFYPTQTKFIVTKSNGTLLEELNGKPALEEYTKALGVSKLTLGVERFPSLSFFAEHPLGLMVGDRAYIRYIARRKGNALEMASKIKEGQILYLMKKGDVIETTQRTMARLKEELGEIKGLILFHCGLRSFEAKKIKVLEKLFKTMKIAPLVGGCTFREYYGFLAMEYSLAILAIGEKNKNI